MWKITVIAICFIALACFFVTITTPPSVPAPFDNRSITVVPGPSQNDIINLVVKDRANERVLSAQEPEARPYGNEIYYTDDAISEIDKMDEAVKQETRDDKWASAAEEAIKQSLSIISSIQYNDLSALCGSSNCVTIIRISSSVPENEKSVAMNLIEDRRVQNGVNEYLSTSRTFSERGADGSFIIHSMMIRH